VILDADPDLISHRLNGRGAHNRLQTGDRCSHDEVRFYAEAIAVLMAGGYNVFRVDCTALTPEQVAMVVLDRVVSNDTRTTQSSGASSDG
jgi:Tfp pilus assembly protein PilX